MPITYIGQTPIAWVQIARLITDLAKSARILVEFDKNLPNFSEFNCFWEAASPCPPPRMIMSLCQYYCRLNFFFKYWNFKIKDKL